MEPIEVIIDKIKYSVVTNDNISKHCKPIHCSLYRTDKNGTSVLETKKYNRIRRRIYNNVLNISKLSDGKIKMYPVYSKLELEILKKYLTNRHTLFGICIAGASYKNIYNAADDINRYFVGYYPPEDNKVMRTFKMYVVVYKGYVNMTRMPSYVDTSKCKHKIYLY